MNERSFVLPPPRQTGSMRWLKRRAARVLRAAGLADRQATAVVDERPAATFVGNNRVLVGARVGDWTIAFYVEADDRLLAPWFIVTGKYEVELTQYLLRRLKPDSHCLDIGANFGFFTCLMARHCPDGRVLGVEPELHIASLARDNLFINNLHDRAGIVCAAASNSGDGLTLYRRTSRSGNTSIVRVEAAMTTSLGEPPVEPFRAESIRIDDLADKFGGRVDVVKIDVEGAEPLVLAGAAETIRANPDIEIIMEWSPGQIAAAGFSVPEFIDDIGRLGLRCFLLDHGSTRPVNAGMLATLPYQAGIVLRRDSRRR